MKNVFAFWNIEFIKINVNKIISLSYEIYNHNVQYEMCKYKICKSPFCTEALEFILVFWVDLQS
jgi:hypothetical protein